MSSWLETFDSWARLWLEALLNSLWQGLLIAVLVWLLLRVLKQASATTRHAVWLVTLLTIGALPFIALAAKQTPTQTPSQIRQPVRQITTPTVNRPAMQPSASVNLAAPWQTTPLVTQSASGPAQAAPSLAQPHATTPTIQAGQNRFLLVEQLTRLNSPVRQAPEKLDLNNAPTAQTEPVALALSPSRNTQSSWARQMLNSVLGGVLPALLVSLWLIGSGLMLWRIARSYQSLFRLRRHFGPVPHAQQERMQQLAESFGIKRRVRLFTSHRISVPMTLGSFRPVIVLPPDLSQTLATTEFDSVIAHELAHIKRWDYLTNLLQRLVHALLFFHPAIWFIGQQLLIERELACDDWAVKTCEPRRYASCLTKLVEILQDTKPQIRVRLAAAGMLFGKHVISRRVEMILNRDRNATTAVSKATLAYAIGLAVLFVAFCSTLSPVIAVPLGQKPAKAPAKKETKAPATPVAKSAELPPLPAEAPSAPALLDEFPPPALAEQLDVTEPMELTVAPAAIAPTAEVNLLSLAGSAALAQSPADVSWGQTPLAVTVPASPTAPLAPLATTNNIYGWAEQDSRKTTPAIPEAELLGLLSDIVKRDADPNVRNEALQGIYRLRSEAAVNTLLGLYDSVSDTKTKGDILSYVLRRDGDNSKAIAKLTAIAKSEPNEELRNRAIRALGGVKGDEGANNLIQIYDGLQDAKMKQYVVRSLAYNKSPKAIEKLKQIAKNDSDPVVRQSAIRSLYSIDGRLYVDTIPGARIGQIDPNFNFSAPRLLEFNGQNFPLDSKKWEDLQKDWQENWEKNQGKFRELIDKLRIEDLDKLRLEMPQIELRLKSLEDELRSGFARQQNNELEAQLRLRMAETEAKLANLRTQYTETHPKVAETRALMEVLKSQLGTVRNFQSRTTRPTNIRRVTPTPSPARVATNSSL
ncbi:MAG: HEAT repeat domain-containing protein [Acidobacteria bacterium]|nr:HEAT repeat domain-containing protein [Acidobacteriota bacterium]